MKYFWIVLLAIFAGIFDVSFFNIGISNILFGTSIILFLFSKRLSELTLTFAFTYGLIVDMYLRVNIGITSLLLIIFVWIFFALRDIIKINPVAHSLIFISALLSILLLFLKFRFNNFDLGKVISSIDVIFILVVFFYSLVFSFFFERKRNTIRL